MEVGRAGEIEREKHEDERERGVYGPRERLVDALIHYLAEPGLPAIQKEIFMREQLEKR